MHILKNWIIFRYIKNAVLTHCGENDSSIISASINLIAFFISFPKTGKFRCAII